MNDILLYLQDKYLGNWMEIYNSLQVREKVEMEQVLKAISKYQNRKFITLLDDEYPEFLKKWYKPPFMVEQVENKFYYIYGENLQEKYEVFEDNQPADKSLGANGGDTLQEQKYINFVGQFQKNYSQLN